MHRMRTRREGSVSTLDDAKTSEFKHSEIPKPTGGLRMSLSLSVTLFQQLLLLSAQLHFDLFLPRSFTRIRMRTRRRLNGFILCTYSTYRGTWQRLTCVAPEADINILVACLKMIQSGTSL